MKYIAYILLFAGVTSILRGLADIKSDGEVVVFGILFILAAAAILKYISNKK